MNLIKSSRVINKVLILKDSCSNSMVNILQLNLNLLDILSNHQLAVIFPNFTMNEIMNM